MCLVHQAAAVYFWRYAGTSGGIVHMACDRLYIILLQTSSNAQLHITPLAHTPHYSCRSEMSACHTP